MTTMREGSVRCLGPHGFHRMRWVEWGDRDNPRVLVCVARPHALRPRLRLPRRAPGGRLPRRVPGHRRARAQRLARGQVRLRLPAILRRHRRDARGHRRGVGRLGGHVDGRDPRHDPRGPAAHARGKARPERRGLRRAPGPPWSASRPTWGAIPPSSRWRRSSGDALREPLRPSHARAVGPPCRPRGAARRIGPVALPLRPRHRDSLQGGPAGRRGPAPVLEGRARPRARRSRRRLGPPHPGHLRRDAVCGRAPRAWSCRKRGTPRRSWTLPRWRRCAPSSWPEGPRLGERPGVRRGHRGGGPQRPGLRLLPRRRRPQGGRVRAPRSGGRGGRDGGIPSRLPQLGGGLHGEPAQPQGDRRPAARASAACESSSGRSRTSCRPRTAATSRWAAASRPRSARSRSTRRATPGGCRRTTRGWSAWPTCCATSSSRRRRTWAAASRNCWAPGRRRGASTRSRSRRSATCWTSSRWPRATGSSAGSSPTPSRRASGSTASWATSRARGRRAPPTCSCTTSSGR